jgi:hypothetical protein
VWRFAGRASCRFYFQTLKIRILKYHKNSSKIPEVSNDVCNNGVES